jgi:hypothetical protein
MKKIYRIKSLSALFVLTAGLLAGCSAINLHPSASRVLVTPNPPEKGCKFLGMIQGDQGNSFTGGFTSNSNLQRGAMNDIRNKAATLGAN